MRWHWITGLALVRADRARRRPDASAPHRRVRRRPRSRRSGRARVPARAGSGRGHAANASATSRPAADPPAGAVVRLPPHRGPATLTFDLHNRHMYSAELVDSGRGYTRATATIGVLAMDRTLRRTRRRPDRVPARRRSARSHRRRRRHGRREGGGAHRQRAGDRSRSPRASTWSAILGEKLVVVRADAHRDDCRREPAHRRRQQRAGAIPSSADVAAAE